jgi:hypothetical protein
MHRRVSCSLHRAASRPATSRVEGPLPAPFDMCELSSTEYSEELQRCCSAVQRVQPALSLPGHDAATGALSPGPGPSQPDHSPSPQHLPPGRPKVDVKNSAAELLRRFPSDKELRNLLLPLECTADPLRQVRQSTRLQLCPRMHPGQTANNGVTKRRKGGRSAFTRRQRNKAAVRRRSRI